MKIITCITFVLSFRTERSVVKNLESIAQLKRGCYRDSSLRSEWQNWCNLFFTHYLNVILSEAKNLKTLTDCNQIFRQPLNNSSSLRSEWQLVLNNSGAKIWLLNENSLSLHPLNLNAEIAQLVEHNLAKVRVASSSLVFRSPSKDARMVEW